MNASHQTMRLELLIDHQTGLILGVETSEFTVLKNNTLALARLGKVFNLPTILTTSFSSGSNGHLMPELVEMYPDHEIINNEQHNKRQQRFLRSTHA